MEKSTLKFIIGVLVLSAILAIPSAYSEELDHRNILNCPKRVFETDEIQGFINKFRESRPDLPPAPKDKHKIILRRTGCMYHFYEYLANDSQKRNLFVIDPYGELYDAKTFE
jgi:hypothetical protein